MVEVLGALPSEIAATGVVGAGLRVAVQLFDPDDHPSTIGVRKLVGDVGGSVVEVPVYRWRLPSDIGPANELIRRLADGALDAVTFTSQPAVRFLARLADDLGLLARVRASFAAVGPTLAVCVGAVCSEAAFEVGFERVVWPSPPRLAPMVRLAEVELS
jgi:uroporphyrinogen-III synthase